MDAILLNAHRIHNSSANEDSNGDPKRREKTAEIGSKISVLVDSSWHELDNDIIETVLARLTVVDFFRLRSVCKGWSSLIRSPSFHAACSKITRLPWFYMLESKAPAGVAYDTEANRWRHINFPGPIKGYGKRKIAVAASGGLICFRSSSSELIVYNPLTGSSRLLPTLKTDHPIIAIAMHTFTSYYKILVAFGDGNSFGMKAFTSTEACWKEMLVTMKVDVDPDERSQEADEAAILNMLDWRGMLDMQRIFVLRGVIHRHQSREISGHITICPNGHEVIHFLNRHGRVVECNAHLGTIYMYPQILPSEIEYSIDMVECGGRIALVVLLEIMESASLRVWEFDKNKMEWKQLMAMPPAMAQGYYGKKVDINCAGYRDIIMICISSFGFHRIVMCNIVEGTWIELPRCYKPQSRTMKRFISAYAFEPRVEAHV